MIKKVSLRIFSLVLKLTSLEGEGGIKSRLRVAAEKADKRRALWTKVERGGATNIGTVNRLLEGGSCLENTRVETLAGLGSSNLGSLGALSCIIRTRKPRPFLQAA